MRPLLRSLLLLLPLCACGPNETVCTAEARSSVQVTVLDSQGHAQRDAHVTYTLDGGAEKDALCNGMTSAQGDCTTWVTSYEQAGHYVIMATSADGTRSTRQEVTVTEGTCHVNTASVTLTLPD